MLIQDTETNRRKQLESCIAESVFSPEENIVNIGLRLL
jgi:hypothetical protein